MLKPRHRAALDVLLPSGGHPDFALGAFDAGFDEFYADFQRQAPLPMRLAFRAALEAACWLSPLLIGRLPPLATLAREDAERALEALGRSRFYLVRQQLLLLKTVLTLHYGGLPGTRRAVGYPG
jgi:hypothetical protein